MWGGVGVGVGCLDGFSFLLGKEGKEGTGSDVCEDWSSSVG